MISIMPVAKKDICKYLNDKSLLNKEDISALLAKDEDDELGVIVLKLDDIYLDIIDINIFKNDKINTEELLLKSAASYAMNRNLFTLRCKNCRIFDNLLRYNGKIIEKYLYIDIIKLISCKCNNKIHLN